METRFRADSPGCGKVESLCMNRSKLCFFIFFFEMKSLTGDKFSVNCFIGYLVRRMFSIRLNGLKLRWWFFGG